MSTEWKGWLTMDALVRAEVSLDKLSGGHVPTPVFQLAMGKPRSYGGSLLHLIENDNAVCGTKTPPLDEGSLGGVVAFHTYEGYQNANDASTWRDYETNVGSDATWLLSWYFRCTPYVLGGEDDRTLVHRSVVDGAHLDVWGFDLRPDGLAGGLARDFDICTGSGQSLQYANYGSVSPTFTV